jgi:hypothetical protein
MGRNVGHNFSGGILSQFRLRKRATDNVRFLQETDSCLQVVLSCQESQSHEYSPVAVTAPDESYRFTPSKSSASLSTKLSTTNAGSPRTAHCPQRTTSACADGNRRPAGIFITRNITIPGPRLKQPGSMWSWQQRPQIFRHRTRIPVRDGRFPVRCLPTLH